MTREQPDDNPLGLDERALAAKSLDLDDQRLCPR